MTDAGWDAPEQLGSSALIPLDSRDAPPPPPTPTPRVPEATPRARSSAELLPELPLPASGSLSLPTEIQEQLFGILRASLDASLVPLLAKQQQLEARLEALRKQPAAAIVASPLTSTRASAPVRPVIPSIPVEAGSISPPPPAKPSVIATSYGFVTTPSTPPRPRQDLDLDLANVGPIEMPDFGTNRAGRVLVFLLLGGVVAAIIATILSHT